MYAYVNTATGRLAALMPSQRRGRPPAKHAENHADIPISINFVPTAVVATCTTVSQLKAHVAAHGSAAAPAEFDFNYLLVDLLEAYHNVLESNAETAALSDKNACKITADNLVKLINAPEILDAAQHDAAQHTAIGVVHACRRIVNAVMHEAGTGWTATTDFAVASSRKERTANAAEPKTVPVPAQITSMIAAADKVDGANGVFCPKADKTYIISRQIENLFKILAVTSQASPQNINLVGPHGCGKTELAIQFAAKYNRPMLIMDCANLREARDWFGYKTARDGTVYWNESQFVRAVQAGNHVVLLDELNRAGSSLLNTLMPLLDDRRFTYLEERGDNIVVGPGTVFFATMNEGAGYTGTSALDRAIRDRFPRAVELTYLGEKDEVNLLVHRTGIEKDAATRLVQLANKIRKDATGLTATLTESISTRQLIAAASDYIVGGVETLEFTITNHFSPDGDEDSERVKVQNIIQGKFGDIMAANAAEGA